MAVYGNHDFGEHDPYAICPHANASASVSGSTNAKVANFLCNHTAGGFLFYSLTFEVYPMGLINKQASDMTMNCTTNML